ncbi:MAG: helix-turn-helix domain-containing protein [Lentisphaerae bacterium]|nr:helix-turn-helix domain-containing protein [Lentisphaerota bacterium]
MDHSNKKVILHVPPLPPTPFRESVWVLPQTELPMPFDLSSAGITCRDRNYRIVSGGRSYYVLEYISAGRGHLFIDNHHYQPAAGDVYLLPPHVPHEYYTDPADPWEKMWFNISGEFIDALLACYRLPGVVYLQQTQLENLFRQGIDQVRFFNQESYSKLAAVITHILSAIYQLQGAQSQKASTEGVIMKNYLDNHWQEKFDLAHLCALSGKSVAQAQRIFKRDFGITPMAYQQKRRYQMAVSYLENTRNTVRDIAMLLGFANEFHFSQWFKKQSTLSPKAYRQQFFNKE